MEFEKCVKGPFTVIGKEGSSLDGEGFIQRLWDEANAKFNEVRSLAKRDAAGALVGIWGVMSDFSLSFQPWEDHFSKGLYLAGVECDDDAQPPEGWVKWTIPKYEYYVIDNSNHTFSEMIAYLQSEHIELAGAVHDYTDPKTGKGYMYFPIKRY